MAAKIYKINFKSDFVLTIQSDAGWAIPFCIKFWTGAPSKAYFVGYDGTNYHNCRMGETSDKLVVLFDDHHLPIGDLQMQIAYHTTIEDFPSVQFDEVTNPVIVKTEIDGQEYNVMLDFTGETAPEIEFSLPAYHNEQQRIANEQERERIFAEMQQAFATMQRKSGSATAGAENVNATLNGTTLIVTDRTGHQTSSNVQGPPGPPGSGVQADWSETDPSADDYIKNKPTIPTVPTNVSAFTNDAGYVTKSVNDLVNYYLKSETYTKTEVQTLINAVKQFTYEVVQTLPTATADTMHKIFLVPSADPQTQNVKDEYITIDNGIEAQTRYTWEQIGSTAIDLSGYVTTTALNTALADYTSTAALTLLLAGKQDTISDLSTIRSGAAAGATAYQKPQGGIPKTDLAQDVKDSLDKADSALQEDTLYVKVNNNGHEYVDLGLPSGTLWAKCNVGADDETGHGNYYMYGKGARQYNSKDAIYEGTENPLDLSVDTARQVLGGSWRMPTQAQMQELVNSTTYEWVTINGINGGKFTAANGNYVFFPAAGNWYYGNQYGVGGSGGYWGSSPDGSDSACFLGFDDGSKDVVNNDRKYGYSVRGVILPDTTQLKKDLESKANKVPNATNGNFAGLDANGNLTDSGSKASDFATTQQLPTTMGASGSGHKGGLVPDTPSTEGTTKFLREDGTWEVPAGGSAAAYTPTLQSAPTSSTTTYTKDGETRNFEVGQFARVANADNPAGYDMWQLYDLVTENDVTTAVWRSTDAVIGDINTILDNINGEVV